MGAIDFFVLQWFMDNKLNATLFCKLPLEILTKIWREKRIMETEKCCQILTNHYLCRTQIYRSTFNLFRGCFNQDYFTPYTTENGVKIDREYLTMEKTGAISKGIIFSVNYKRPETKNNLCVTALDEESNLTRILSRRTLFQFTVLETNDEKYIEYKNFTKEKTMEMGFFFI